MEGNTMKVFDVGLTQAELLALAAWAQAKKHANLNDRAMARAAIAAFNGKVKVLEAGTARGANFMQRKTARALPMRSYDGHAT